MIRFVKIQLSLTDTQVCALVALKRGSIKGWGVPEYLAEQTLKELSALGLIDVYSTLTTSGELVILATGNDSVVTQ